MKKRIVCIVIIICLLISFGTTITIEWLYDTFGNLSIDEIIFHIKVPMEGTNTDIIWGFIKQSLSKIIVLTFIVSFVLIYPMVKDLKIVHKINTSERKKKDSIYKFLYINCNIDCKYK